MRNENDFLNFKYKLFKNGMPDSETILEKLVAFREGGVTPEVNSLVDAEINKLALNNPDNMAPYLSEISPENKDKYISSDAVARIAANKRQKELEEKQKELEEKQKELEEKQKELEEKQRQINISKIIITSGQAFEGYRIVKYSGYISGDDATLVKKHVSGVDYTVGVVTGIANIVENVNRAKDDATSFSNFAQNTTDAFAKIRRQAIKELKEAAYDLDCNAVIGVDFDYVTVDTSHDKVDYTLVCVTANGNACIIEPINDGFDNFNDVFDVKDGKVVK